MVISAVALAVFLASCTSVVSEKPPDAAGTISASGGKVTVDDPNSPINGVSVEAEAGAFDTNTAIEIREITDTLPPPDGYTESVSPCIEIQASSDLSPDGYVTLKVPIAEAHAESAMILGGDVKSIRTKSVFHDIAFVVTSAVDAAWEIFHPTSVVDGVASVVMPGLYTGMKVQAYLRKEHTPRDPIDLPSYTVSGFDPDLDRLCATNGDPERCAGMTYFAGWYWNTHRSQERLIRVFDIEEAHDIALAAEKKIPRSLRPAFWDSKQRDIYEIIEVMERTKQPVPVTLATKSSGFGGLHSVLAFSWDGSVLRCMDPNAWLVSPPKVAMIKEENGEWVCEGADGVTYQGVSKSLPIARYASMLSTLYDQWKDLSVDITLSKQGISNTQPSASIHPGDEVTLMFGVNI